MARLGKQKDRERPPDIGLLLKPALAVAFVAILYALGAAVFSSSSIEVLDTSDSLLMREVFFGEGAYQGSYAVLCYSAEDMAKNRPMFSSFSDAHGLLASLPVKFVAVDCSATLPSGSTISERFKIDATARPAAVVVTGGRISKPVQIRGKDMKTGYQLAKTLR